MNMVSKIVSGVVTTSALAMILTACGQAANTGSSGSPSNSSAGGSSGGSNSASNSAPTSNSASSGSTSKKYVIALSNSYYGNTWRHQMVQAFESQAKTAEQEGLISNFIVENGDGSVNQQTSQMNDLILKQVNAIAIDSASPTALNGVIQKAEAAGIKVISFDSVVTDPQAYKLTFSFKKLGSDGASFVAKKLHGKGNILIVRGVAGSEPDKEMYQGQMDVIKQYPGLKVVGTVYGMATTSVAESKVAALLPSLPKVDAVLCQGGGDDYGVLQAFQSAGRPIPIITAGGDAEFLHWWAGQAKNNGYSTYSESSTPGVGGAAFWLTYDILNGVKPANTMIMPNAIVTNANIAQYANMKPGTIVSPSYSNNWVQQNLLSQK